MKTIKISDEISFELDLEEQVRVKDMRRTETVLNKGGTNIEMVEGFVIAFSREENREIIENMSPEEFKILDKEVATLLTKIMGKMFDKDLEKKEEEWKGGKKKLLKKEKIKS